MIKISSTQIITLILGNVVINIIAFALGYMKGREDTEKEMKKENE